MVIILDDELVLSGNREEHLEILRNLRPIDDAFMTKVFEDKECAQLLLRVILDRDDLTVEKAVTQWDIKNLQGRSTRLDIYAVDSAGKHYDVEVQRENKGAEPKRARYNGSLMDAMNNEALSDRTRYFKETKEGVDIMCKLMEDYGQKREARGEARDEARGAEKKSKEIARNIWESGIKDFQKIADLTKLPVDEVKKLLEGETA